MKYNRNTKVSHRNQISKLINNSMSYVFSATDKKGIYLFSSSLNDEISQTLGFFSEINFRVVYEKKGNTLIVDHISFWRDTDEGAIAITSNNLSSPLWTLLNVSAKAIMHYAVQNTISLGIEFPD